MSLVTVARPWTESELAVMLAMLDAAGIPCFVQGRHFGSLWPGVQIAAYNARQIRVPAECVDPARACLAPLQATGPDRAKPTSRPRSRAIVRMLLEWLLIGWCLPPPAARQACEDDLLD